MARLPFLIGLLVLVVRLATFPRTPWDAAELRFPFAPMVALSVLASVVTAIAMAKWGPVLRPGDPDPGGDTAGIAAVLFSLSAAVLVHAPAARLDALAWMFLALAILSLQRPVLFGALAGGAAACGIASAVALLFAALMLVVPARRDRFYAAGAFVLVLLPFVSIPETLGSSETLVQRFTLHPWGSKVVTLPLLVVVAAGIRPLMRRWSRELEVLLWFAAVHVALGIAVVDPADGVRYAVPSLMFTAFVAAEGLRALRVSWVGAALVAALSVWYAYPILRDRVTRPSPPIEAARAIPPGVTVLVDRDTAAFARGIPLDEGLRRHLDDDVPLLHFVHGNSNEPGARVFSRPAADAYGKLTRNAYRHVALVPVEQRFAPVVGVFALERNEAGESWRWLERYAELLVPRGRDVVRVTLRLPADAAIESNEVQINATRATVRRGQSVEVPVPLEQPRLLFRAARQYQHAAPDAPGVAVQLVRIR